jgi:hypothetical protein
LSVYHGSLILELVCLAVVAKDLHDDVLTINVGKEKRLAKVPAGGLERLLEGLGAIVDRVLSQLIFKNKEKTRENLKRFVLGQGDGVLLSVHGEDQLCLLGVRNKELALVLKGLGLLLLDLVDECGGSKRIGELLLRKLDT